MSDHIGRPNGRGFALLEVLIAASIVIAIAAGSSMIAAMALRASERARTRTIATALASGKIEQLRSLTWAHVTTSAPAISMSTSDVTTDVSVEPATDSGPGLLASPAGTLDANLAGYVDYLDAKGQWVGTGTVMPQAAVFVRRWAIQPSPVDPDNIIGLVVVAGTRGRAPGLLSDPVRLVTLEARK